VGYLVEILATYAGKWREIGLGLGFSENELDSLPFSPKPANSLTYMLNEWIQWTVGGNHDKYVSLEDLERALRTRIVNLEVVADELRGRWMQAKGTYSTGNSCTLTNPCIQLITLATKYQGLRYSGSEYFSVATSRSQISKMDC